MKNFFTAVVLISTLGIAAKAEASIHAPLGFAGTVTETQQQALLLHDGKYEHLILSTRLHCAAGMPRTIGWVIPLPSPPLHHDTMPTVIFKQAESLTDDGKPSSGPTPEAKPALSPYRVTTLTLEGEESAPVLNRWLAANGFQAAGLDELQPYLRPGAAFVAVKVDGLTGTEVELPPLHLTFSSDVLTLPLRSSANSGIFNVTLYVVTADRLPMTALRRSKLRGRQSIRLTKDSPAPLLLRLLPSDPGYLTRFDGENLNTPGRFVRDMDNDPNLAPDTTR